MNPWASEEMRVVLGDCEGVKSPLEPPTTNVLLLDMRIAAGARLDLTLCPVDCLFLWMMSGSAEVMSRRGVQPLVPHALDGLDAEGSGLVLDAGASGARFVVTGGTPLAQPTVAQGPFVLDSKPALERAKARYARGAMGWLAPTRYGPDRSRLPASSEEVVLLPAEGE